MAIGRKYNENLKDIATEIVTEGLFSGKPFINFLKEFYQERKLFLPNFRCYKCLNKISSVGIIINRKEEIDFKSKEHKILNSSYVFHPECLDEIVFKEAFK